MFNRIFHSSLKFAFGRMGFYKCPVARKIFWNLQAKYIDEQWGTLKIDYDVLKDIISLLAVYHILDIGCGCGRLFPLYESLRIKEVIGQDISKSALNIAKERYNYSPYEIPDKSGCIAISQGENIKLINLPISALDFPDSYFDIVISNRVLQHIPLNSIESTIETICRLGKFVYINEHSDTDEISPNQYLFKYDYVRLFSSFGFIRGF